MYVHDQENQQVGCVIIFDLRVPGAPERFHRERAAWPGSADVEVLDENHAALIVRPGSARRLIA